MRGTSREASVARAVDSRPPSKYEPSTSRATWCALTCQSGPLPRSTATATSGFSAGAKPTNHEYDRYGSLRSSDPVLPATAIPGKSGRFVRLSRKPRRAVPNSVVPTIMRPTARAAASATTRRSGAAAGRVALPSRSTTRSMSRNGGVTPPRASVAASQAPCSGDSVVFQKPAAVRANGSPLSGTVAVDGSTGSANGSVAPKPSACAAAASARPSR